MPVDLDEFEREGRPPEERKWRQYERAVTNHFQTEFQQEFAKRKILLGKPREFDAVSNDGEIIVQIKYTGKPLANFTQQELVHYFERYMLDAIKLERTQGSKKILVVYPEEMKVWFLRNAEGLISPDIEVLTVPFE